MQTNPLEKHFTTKQIGEAWGLDRVSIFRMFVDEPGVMKLGALTERRQTRRELRIPESVMNKVYAERLNRR